VPTGSSPSASRKSRLKRSSMVMSVLLDELDSAFGTVRDGKTTVLFFARRHDAVAQHLPVSFVVVAEQAGCQVVAAAMALA
jgi:hypothetical protein